MKSASPAATLNGSLRKTEYPSAVTSSVASNPSQLQRLPQNGNQSSGFQNIAEEYPTKKRKVHNEVIYSFNYLISL